MKKLSQAFLVLLGLTTILFSFVVFVMRGVLYIFIALLGLIYPEKFDILLIGKGIGYIVFGSVIIGFILVLFYAFSLPSKWVSKSKNHRLPIDRNWFSMQLIKELNYI